MNAGSMTELSGARAVLFTDLDGTLLDGATCEPSAEAVRVVEEALARGVVTVPVTSKTAPEVRRLEAVLPLAPVAVVEGGAVLLIAGEEPVLLGPPRQRMVAILSELRRSGHAVRGLSGMDVAEVVRRTGLGRDAARRAMERAASEPFVFLQGPREGEEESLRRRASSLGASVARGDRLWHLAGAGIDKGRGIEAVLERYPDLASLPAGAVGDAWNDLPMLCRVEHRYLLGRAVGDGDLACTVERIPEAGPPGFVRAMRRFLETLTG